jgi:CMP-N,N'-diacetyllegionaminic acid synthase
MKNNNSNTVLAVIPARAGSKRLKNKNMLPLGNIPLIQWTINAATKAKNITKVVVTSDDLLIKDLCQKLNVEFILRPTSLAQDTSSSLDVIIHSINFLAEKKETYEYLLLLQPTSPFRTHKHIDEAYNKLITKNADAIISIKKATEHFHWSKELNSDLNMSDFEVTNQRKQDLPSSYNLNGAIYLVKISELIKQNTLFLRKNSYGFLMSDIDSIDVDTLIDYQFCQFLYKSGFIS